jgi:plasmid replication initiation protein
MSTQNKEILDARSQIVVKHNDLIQKSRYNLSTQEQKIILYLISKIKPEDTDLILYEFNIKEFCEICGIDETSGKNYSNLKETIINLKRKCFWIPIGNGIEATVSWIDKAIINKSSGTIKIKLDNDLKPFLLELQRNFTRYELDYILTMKSKYSIRLYELLKSYEFMSMRTFDVENLQILLSAENYKNYSDFRLYALEPALREINIYSDIKVTYEAKKKGKKYDKITFEIKEKNATEQLMTKNKIY